MNSNNGKNNDSVLSSIVLVGESSFKIVGGSNAIQKNADTDQLSLLDDIKKYFKERIKDVNFEEFEEFKKNNDEKNNDENKYLPFDRVFYKYVLDKLDKLEKDKGKKVVEKETIKKIFNEMKNELLGDADSKENNMNEYMKNIGSPFSAISDRFVITSDSSLLSGSISYIDAVVRDLKYPFNNGNYLNALYAYIEDIRKRIIDLKKDNVNSNNNEKTIEDLKQKYKDIIKIIYKEYKEDFEDSIDFEKPNKRKFLYDYIKSMTTYYPDRFEELQLFKEIGEENNNKNIIDNFFVFSNQDIKIIGFLDKNMGIKAYMINIEGDEIDSSTIKKSKRVLMDKKTNTIRLAYYTYKDNNKLKLLCIDYKKHIIIYNGEFDNSSDMPKLNGKGKEYGENGKLIFEGEYLNGVRNGKGKEYGENGKLIFEGEYLNGVRNGEGKEYGEDGKLIFEGEYEDNLKAGIGIRYFDNGDIELLCLYESEEGEVTYPIIHYCDSEDKCNNGEELNEQIISNSYYETYYETFNKMVKKKQQNKIKNKINGICNGNISDIIDDDIKLNDNIKNLLYKLFFNKDDVYKQYISYKFKKIENNDSNQDSDISTYRIVPNPITKYNEKKELYLQFNRKNDPNSFYIGTMLDNTQSVFNGVGIYIGENNNNNENDRNDKKFKGFIITNGNDKQVTYVGSNEFWKINKTWGNKDNFFKLLEESYLGTVCCSPVRNARIGRLDDHFDLINKTNGISVISNSISNSI